MIGYDLYSEREQTDFGIESELTEGQTHTLDRFPHRVLTDFLRITNVMRRVSYFRSFSYLNPP